MRPDNNICGVAVSGFCLDARLRVPAAGAVYAAHNPPNYLHSLSSSSSLLISRLVPSPRSDRSERTSIVVPNCRRLKKDPGTKREVSGGGGYCVSHR